MKKGFGSFGKSFWTAITMEFFERGSYYGVMSILSVYLVLSTDQGGLGFTKEKVGIIKSVITPLLYILPIVAGAIADRFGYRKTLFFAFAVMSSGYFLTSISTSYSAVFLSLTLMAIGAGTFKPIISGTIARTTNESNSSLGFGIYYWSINLGAFLFPLLLVPYLKSLGWNYILLMAAFGTGWLLLLNFFVFREPSRPQSQKNLVQVFADMLLVLKDYKFILTIVIYSGFWILYFQMYDSVLWFLKERIDMTPVNNAVNSFLTIFVDNPSWRFDAEHVTVVNAGTIILLQLIVSAILKNAKPLQTMIVGISFGTLGLGLLAISTYAWVFILGLVIFTIGEMTAHPKFISYIGLIAPQDKKALYLGYSFLYGVIGSGVGGVLGAFAYVRFVTNMNRPELFWLMFCGIGVLTIIGLIVFNRFVLKDSKQS
ncbi:MAG: MFS transporter [Tenuifilum sp.]|uniref:MFS transporter n=1 Tax=Tenuifilum sp. TaxID=2760880 RepID=UPI001B684AEE|nr:MFS transporter [Bacteroidales bacterium]